MVGHDYLANPAALRLQVARASAALPAAGAFDAAPTEVICIGMDYALFYFSYIRGGAGGDVQFTIEVSPYVQDILAPAGQSPWARATVFSAGAVVSGADSLSNIQRNTTEYGSTAAPVEVFVYGPLDLMGCVQRIRVACAESGNVGAPGTCGVVVYFSVRGG